MKLSSKGRYAVMAMVDIAKYAEDKPCKLSNIALRQNISLHYLEQIFLKLKKSNLVRSHRGPGGGYKLLGSKKDINSATSFCTGKNVRCLTHDLWEDLEILIEGYLESVSLHDLVVGNKNSFLEERNYEQS